MGTHISKVKSVDLDAWTDDQVENMVRWGNQKANLYWESKLPDGYIPDQLKIENFIRTKYELKKWKDSQDIRSFNPATVQKLHHHHHQLQLQHHHQHQLQHHHQLQLLVVLHLVLLILLVHLAPEILYLLHL